MRIIVNIKRIILLISVTLWWLVPNEIQAQSANDVLDKMKSALKREKNIFRVRKGTIRIIYQVKEEKLFVLAIERRSEKTYKKL